MTYDYECRNDGCDTDQFTVRGIPVDDRHSVCCQECFEPATLVILTAPTVVSYETHYDEGLGIDISGPRERKQAMKALNLVEAGDKVRGSRLEDKHAGVEVGRLAPTGRTLSDYQRDQEARRESQNAPVTVEHSDGKTSVVRPSELPSFSSKELRIKRNDSKMNRQEARKSRAVDRSEF